MTKELRDRRLEDHKAWYCPNGHAQSYTGKTEAEKLRERLEREEARAERLRIQVEHARAETDRQKRKLAAAKGQATKAKNRAAKGVCPHPECKRSFVDVARHVKTCHPELVDA